MANRGTLFLDEVGDIPLDLQPKLLRALQEKAFERLGGTKTIPIDVRLVAATNRNLTQMMGDKLFRSDLYYRLKVFPITTPPLRDHPEDIPILARHFTKKYAARWTGKSIRFRRKPCRHWCLVLAGKRTRTGKFHRALGDSVAGSQPARAAWRDQAGRRGGRRQPLNTRTSGARSHLQVLRESNGVVTTAAAAWASPAPP